MLQLKYDLYYYHKNLGCIGMYDEEMVALLQTAFKNCIVSLRQKHRENFYYFAFIFDEGMRPYISAWSYEAYNQAIIDNEIDDDDREWRKWDYADSPYAVYGYDEFFSDVSKFLNDRASKMTDDELYDVEWNTIFSSMEEALIRLDKLNFFGTGKERKEIIINVEQAPPDENSGEYERAIRLNPPSPLLDEYLEFCESEEDD